MTEAGKKQGLLGKYWWVGGLIVALALVVILAPNASSNPDGLEKVAQDKEFSDKAEDSGYEWLPGYSIPGVESEFWSTVISGAVGVGILAVAVGGIAFLLTRRSAHRSTGGAGPVPGAG